MPDTTKKVDPYTIRPITVRALVDCDCVTHTLKKGQVTEMQSDHAAMLVAEGKVEYVEEKAVAEPAYKEKRG